jgi:hypothetical protein
MTDIDPKSDIELSTVDEQVVVRVPLAGQVAANGSGAISGWPGPRRCRCRLRHDLTGPGLWSACQPTAIRRKWRRRWTLPVP